MYPIPILYNNHDCQNISLTEHVYKMWPAMRKGGTWIFIWSLQIEKKNIARPLPSLNDYVLLYSRPADTVGGGGTWPIGSYVNAESLNGVPKWWNDKSLTMLSTLNRWPLKCLKTELIESDAHDVSPSFYTFGKVQVHSWARGYAQMGITSGMLPLGSIFPKTLVFLQSLMLLPIPPK